ncbi:hypothetical protein FA15DRAFT_702910 [Coprinopsis marcescibilis]|uniref:Uncharacterized protein n=1 Tax=Coprinopsis marcescibilis TaxID=230819 RepID=A0A5C3L0N0_COPMA|nr:hypothetical protein FA15DRAFT_702910 [Coprinopsis marcescibilis]
MPTEVRIPPYHLPTALTSPRTSLLVVPSVVDQGTTMITISRTTFPGDLVLDIKPSSSTSMKRVPMPLSLSKIDHKRSVAPRSFGSASTSDSSDPFSDISPWTALFESTIWSPCNQRESFHVELPIDVSKQESEAISMTDTVPDLSLLLDRTTLDFDFDHSCLEGLDDTLLHAPKDAFASVCWETATTAPTPEEQSDCSPAYRNSIVPSVASSAYQDIDSPIPLFLSPSMWSDGEDSDSESEYSDEDDECYSNNTITGARLAHNYVSPLEKPKDLWFDDDDTSLVVFQPHWKLLSESDPEKSIGFSPQPIIPRRSKSVSTRLATFCANIPTRLTLVRSGTAFTR